MMHRSLLVLSAIALLAACKPEEEPAPVCTYEGVGYPDGATFGAADGCNTCWCTTSGAVSCTRMACEVPTTCDYGGETYDAGDTFAAIDGCNTCTCGDDGVVGCTKMACACNPATEHDRDYVGESPAMCQVIRFTCPPGATYFSNECGCGCEQPADCPEVFSCMPSPGVAPCDLAALKARCPYSAFAL